jgi:hypothetical protein
MKHGLVLGEFVRVNDTHKKPSASPVQERFADATKKAQAIFNTNGDMEDDDDDDDDAILQDPRLICL